ncbi:universal stress protein UspA [Adhaeribacter aerolatus]|uniref:Universal stress protein UspA n=1 Tax=Adhaeribacter aerolatus TaxID=670289 RepID=A0A512ASM4_9BACT|nr:universal stress protein [Adhaeribacter aerolatus]GEO02706.1 universal stress protein UspA [Adhaeribacter aerolatus]
MKKIICPTDFSKAATNAVEFAAIIAGRVGASITLLHVLHLPILDTTETAMVASEVLSEQRRHAQEKLHALSHYLSEKHRAEHLQIDYLVKESLLGDEVKRLTETQGYDMVVIGSTGGGNTLEEILVGSNTAAVIERVKCPVLTVPLKALPAPFQRMVYASNYEKEDSFALQQVLQFAHLFGAKVEIVHVSAEASEQSKANRFRERLRQELPDFALEFHEVIHPDEVEGMKKYLAEKNADLLAILKKRRGFFHNLFSQSFSEQLTYQSKLPMLIIHEP